VVNFYLGLVGGHPSGKREHPFDFSFLLDWFYLLLIGFYLLLKGIRLCKHFFSVGSYFGQQARHHLFRLHSLAV
jgi:high-affinity Fe2+/Pb2+ permease